MENYMQLVPALTVIESNLFPPTAELTSAPADVAEIDVTAAVPPLPAQLAALIAVRVDAAAQFATQPLRPGVIVRLHAPHGLAVLLTAAATDGWHGAVVSSDTDYASAADVVLTDQDALRDPQAAVVQTWNQLIIQPVMIDSVIGALDAAQCASVAEIAAEWRAEQHFDAAAAPGLLWQRTTASGQLVVTGTPLGSDTDPRRRYQALYRAAALRVQAAASAPAAAPSVLERVLLGLRAAAHSWQMPLEQVLQPTLGDDAAAQWRIGDMLELELIVAENGAAVHIHARWQPPQAVRIELIAADGQVRQSQQLDASCPLADLFAGADEHLTLRIYALDERLLFAAPFPDLMPAIHYGENSN
jgi:hypothetical protein